MFQCFFYNFQLFFFDWWISEDRATPLVGVALGLPGSIVLPLGALPPRLLLVLCLVAVLARMQRPPRAC